MCADKFFQPAGQPRDGDDDQPGHQRARILVVDDEVTNLNVIVAQLKHERYDIVTAASGEEALDQVDQQRPDLILLDAMMPGISGFDVAEILKSEAHTATIPIIMLTALSDGESRIAALSHGVEEFLTKPVARNELQMRIRNLLKLKKFQDGLADYNSLLQNRVAERTTALEDARHELTAAHEHLAQSEKMAAIGQLAAGVAHEINNPIGYVNSNLGTLKGYVKDLLRIVDAYEAANQGLQSRDAAHGGDAQRRLQQLKRDLELDYLKQDAPMLINESIDGIGRVCKIVQDLKGFAHADVDPGWERSDLHESLEAALNIANNEIKYRATIVRDYGTIPEVDCLPSQINQVFLNLLVNAAQAIPENEHGRITVRTVRSGDEVWIDVTDSGCGIIEENLSRIFEPFFTTKPVGRGTGLGLSLSHSIVQRHHGRLEVRSEEGRGTTFRVVLPIHHHDESVEDGPANTQVLSANTMIT